MRARLRPSTAKPIEPTRSISTASTSSTTASTGKPTKPGNRSGTPPAATGQLPISFKGLIKLAAAGVKARESRSAGVRQHAQRAAELFRSVSAGEDHSQFGLSLSALLDNAEQTATAAERLAGTGRSDSSRRLPIALVLD